MEVANFFALFKPEFRGGNLWQVSDVVAICGEIMSSKQGYSGVPADSVKPIFTQLPVFSFFFFNFWGISLVHNLIFFFVGIQKVIKWNTVKPLEVPLEVFQTHRPPFHMFYIVFQAQNLGQARKGPQKLVFFFTETLFFF